MNMELVGLLSILCSVERGCIVYIRRMCDVAIASSSWITDPVCSFYVCVEMFEEMGVSGAL